MSVSMRVDMARNLASLVQVLVAVEVAVAQEQSGACVVAEAWVLGSLLVRTRRIRVRVLPQQGGQRLKVVTVRQITTGQRART